MSDKNENTPDKKKIDWEFWRLIHFVSLGEAIMLSLNKIPDEYTVHQNPTGIFSILRQIMPDGSRQTFSLPEEMRYSIALSAIGLEKGLKSIPNKSRVNIPKGMPCVDLREFGSWAKSKGFELPQEFPCQDETFDIRQPSEHFISLPYKCEFMESLSELMWKHYNTRDPKKLPKQETVIEDLVKLTGINARTSKTIASKIKPNHLSK